VGPQVGQRFGELEHVVELLAVAVEPPDVVVPVLAAPPGVDAGGLDVAVGHGTDPHVLPGRRDDEVLDAGEGVGVGDAAPAGVEVDESPPRPPPRQAGTAAVDAAQARHAVAFPVPVGGKRARTRQGPGAIAAAGAPALRVLGSTWPTRPLPASPLRPWPLSGAPSPPPWPRLRRARPRPSAAGPRPRAGGQGCSSGRRRLP